MQITQQRISEAFADDNARHDKVQTALWLYAALRDGGLVLDRSMSDADLIEEAFRRVQ